MWLKALLLLLLLGVAFADSSVTHPGILFLDLGGLIGVLGDFSGLSFYDYTNASAFLSASDSSQSLYLRNTSSNENVKIATVEGGSISQLLLIVDDLVLIQGDFSSFNGVSYIPPIIYNVSSGEIETIFSLTLKRDESVTGDVKTTFVDGHLIYLGGDFEYKGTHGAAVYNVTSKTVSTLPFEGFGENSTVNSIIKYQDGEEGSIIFAGSFDTLGLSELLKHNITLDLNSHNSTNTTNSSLISAEQVVSLKHATISSVNGGSGSDSSLICPSEDVAWSFADNVGGQWLAELPSGMKGITPTKIRLYVPEDSSDGVKVFRLYTYPNNGIMNLTYVDPATNELAYCDAWCPLLLGSSLQQHTEDNIDDAETIMEDNDDMFVQDDGSFTMYYDLSTKAKNLGYGRNYQEFALINEVGVDKVGLTVTAWYGSKAALSGVELYLDSIRVYGNDTLNDSNCGGESEINSASINNGTWQSVQSLSDSVTDTDYLVSVVDSSTAAITLYPNISYAGDYSILFYTPGCSADGSCDKRSIVSVSVIDTEDNVVASSQIYQNNLEDKFDYLFYGHLNGSSTSEGKNRITIQYEKAIDPSVTDPWVVVDKVVANIVSLDNYYLKNNTNTTNSHNGTESHLLSVSLNGLFEYSLGNFSDFEKDLVYTKVGNKTVIKETNNFVGNSSINLLSGELSLDSVVNQILMQNSSDATKLLLLGDFSSSNSSLLNKSILTLNAGGYNASSNSTLAQLAKRQLYKRADVEYMGVLFNNTISTLYNVGAGFIATGDFSASGGERSSFFKNLANDNKTTSTANNFALYLDGSWYSFGNNYTSGNYSRFVQIEIDGSEYFIFSTEDNIYKVWDNTNRHWPSSGTLDISTALTLEERDHQLIGGSSFGVMDFYGIDEAYVLNNTQFNSFGLNISSGSVLSSFFVDLALSVISGRFETEQSINNVALLKNDVASALNGSLVWGDGTAVTTMYVDNEAQYLFLGTNGSVLTASNNITGLIVYSLSDYSFASVQPATLSTNDNSNVRVNALVYYDEGKQLLVGGHFDNAGSLECPSICIYDVQNTRWIDPMSSGSSIGGNVTDARFLSSNQVLLSGNMTVNDTDVAFAVYNFASGLLEDAGSDLNDNIAEPQKYIINEKSSGELTNRLAAYGAGFVVGFNGSEWGSIAKGIDFSSKTTFTDLKLLKLSKANSANLNQQYFDNDQALMLSGIFNLTDYGLVNAALFDGTSWIPYIFSLSSSGVGVINSLLLEDVYRYQSSSDLETSRKRLTAGKIVGISLACAIGSTALIGALFLIPMFHLFKDTKRRPEVDQRIHEDDMMEAVDPGELLHEIDIQRK